ncbi:MAG: aldo/keto reductase [Bdellovibrionota bacterium]
MAKLDSKSRIKMNDGRSIPILGLGVYQSRPGKTTVDAVRAALELGYRHVDTASMYGNEADVGRAVRECGIPRKDVFVTTKLWNDDHGYDEAMRAFDSSVIELGLEYVDLYLIHWPVPKLRLDSWRAMKEIAKSGRAKSIGVSNYTIKHLEELADRLGDVPAVNQVEFSPFLFQRDLLDYCAEKKIVIEAYSPLTRGKRLKDRRVAKVAESLGKSPAQVLLRWCLEKGLVVLPKSTHRERIEENGEIFDFEMSEGDLAVLDDLNEDLHVSWDPTNQK